MKWYEIIRLVLFIFKILDLLPKEKKKEAEIEVSKAIAKVVSENQIA